MLGSSGRWLIGIARLEDLAGNTWRRDQMDEKPTLYFEDGGAECTEPTLKAARERALEIKPEAVVVSSSTGKTALEAGRIFEGTGFRIIAVPFQKHFWDSYTPVDPEIREQCEALGVDFLPDEPLVRFFDNEMPGVANAFRTLSQGFKVAMQVGSMCVDTGILRDSANIIAIGGTHQGADTAICVTVRGYEALLSSNVTGIIALPRP